MEGLLHLLAAKDLGFGQVKGIHCTLHGDAGHVDHIFSVVAGFKAQDSIPVLVVDKLTGFLGCIDLAEGAGNVIALQGADLPGSQAEHIIQIILHIITELVPVHAVDMEIQGHGLGQIVRFPAEGGGNAGIVGHIRIGRGIDEHLCVQLIEAALCEDLGAGDGAVLHFAAGEHRMVQQGYAALHGHVLPDDLHTLGVKGGGGGAEAHAVRHMAAAEAPADHFLGHFFRNTQNHLLFTGMEGHLGAGTCGGHGTAQVGVLLDQNGLCSLTGAGNGCNGAGRAAADDCHVKGQLLHLAASFLSPIHSTFGQRHGPPPRTGHGYLFFPASRDRWSPWGQDTPGWQGRSRSFPDSDNIHG